MDYSVVGCGSRPEPAHRMARGRPLLLFVVPGASTANYDRLRPVPDGAIAGATHLIVARLRDEAGGADSE